MPACALMCLHSLEFGSSVHLSKAHFEYNAERLVAAGISLVVSFLKPDVNEFLACIQISMTKKIEFLPKYWIMKHGELWRK